MKARSILIWHGLMGFILLAGVFLGLTASVIYDVYNPTRIQVTSEYQVCEHFDAWKGEWVLDKKTYIDPVIYVSDAQQEGFFIQKTSSDGTPISSVNMVATTDHRGVMSYWDTFQPENKELRGEYWESIFTQIAYYFAMYVQWIPWIPIMIFTISLPLVFDYFIQKEDRKSSR